MAAAADAIYTGNIITIDDANPSAQALPIVGGRITAVSSRDDVLAAHRGPAPG